MEDAVHALIMGFSVLVFVIGLSIAMHMFTEANTTAQNFLYYADKTNYLDNIELDTDSTNRIVDFDIVIPTLYRYYKENFCVKICDADGSLLQIFDVNLEGEVRKASAISAVRRTQKEKAYHLLYNDSTKDAYLFEAPWIGSTDENIKTRIDYFINGKAGYINNTYVDYKDNKFYKIREKNKEKELEQQSSSNPETFGLNNKKLLWKEEFISYTYTGATVTNDEGDVLVEGEKPEDKIVIIYTAKIPKEVTDSNPNATINNFLTY